MPDLVLFAEGAVKPNFIQVVSSHWNFCILHFLEFAIWGAWYVVLANLLNARGFSRTDIGRIYSTVPIGAILSPLFIGYIADQYFNTEVLLGGLHIIGAVFLFLMAKSDTPRKFYWFCFCYALAFAPTLSLVNSIIFAHNQDLFDGNAGNQFFWIRVFGTIGWICAGLSLKFFIKKDQPVNSSPIVLAACLSLVLGLVSFTLLPETPPMKTEPVDQQILKADTDEDGSLSEDEVKAVTEKGLSGHVAKADADNDSKITKEEIEAYAKSNAAKEGEDPLDKQLLKADTDEDGSLSADEIKAVRYAGLGGHILKADADKDSKVTKEEIQTYAKNNSTTAAFMGMLRQIPGFLFISLIIAIAMAIYFAFAGLFVEKSGIKASNVGPVMTIGQGVEIFFMIALPSILGAQNERMLMVLTIGIIAWAVRFGAFAIGRPLGLVLFGVAIHGICFDFFFATGFTYVDANAPAGLGATAQSLYNVVVFGFGMYIGTEGSGWLNRYLSRKVENGKTSESGEEEMETNWRVFWAIPCVMVIISLLIFLMTGGK